MNADNNNYETTKCLMHKIHFLIIYDAFDAVKKFAQ